MEPGINHTIRHDPIFLEKRAADAPGQPAEAAKQLQVKTQKNSAALIGRKMKKTAKEVFGEIESDLASRYNGIYTEDCPETYDSIINGIKQLHRMTDGMEASRIDTIQEEVHFLKSLIDDLFSTKNRSGMMSREAIPTHIEKTLMHLKGQRAFKIQSHW